MFYDKEIEIITDSGYLDDNGLWVDGEISIIKTIECDVQPYISKLNYRDFSYDKDAKYRVFCDVDEILKLGTCFWQVLFRAFRKLIFRAPLFKNY
ncbi:MAG: hypothetical protein M0Q88_08550 [Bacilli bacterium]|nr:hypothetical protein [Bacilli bacterium]